MEEILKALSSKLTLHPSVDLPDLAAESEGFSGADLQAVVYNAHLDVVHASIADAEVTEGASKGKGKGKGKTMENGPEKAKRNYRQVVPKEDGVATSSTERAVMTNRVSFPRLQ